MNKLTPMGKFFVYLILISGAILFMSPLIWMLSTALKPLNQTMLMPPKWLPYMYYTVENDKKKPIIIEDKINYPAYIIQNEDEGERFIVPQKQIVNGQWLQKDANGNVIKTPVNILRKLDASPEKIYVKVRPQVESKELGTGKILDWHVVASNEVHRKVSFQWKNFPNAIDEMKYFWNYLANTLVICFLGCIFTVYSSALVAYGFSKIDWKGRNYVFILLLSTMMIPFTVTMVPLYAMFKYFGMIGTLQPLWIGTLFGSAFSIFLLRQFFMTIPKDLSDAAKIDGCSEFGIFAKIILPMSKPALLTVGMFYFIYAWNDFVGPLIYLTDQKTYTLALGLQFFQSLTGGTAWHYLMAVSTIMIFPVVVLFLFTQKHFIEGISTTGFKS